MRSEIQDQHFNMKNSLDKQQAAALEYLFYELDNTENIVCKVSAAMDIVDFTREFLKSTLEALYKDTT